MGILEKDKDDRRKEVLRGPAEELLLIRITQGHIQVAVNGWMRFYIPIAIAFIILVFAIPRSGTWERQGRADIQDPAFNITTHILHINTTLGSLVRELEKVQTKLSKMQEDYSKL